MCFSSSNHYQKSTIRIHGHASLTFSMQSVCKQLSGRTEEQKVAFCSECTMNYYFLLLQQYFKALKLQIFWWCGYQRAVLSFLVSLHVIVPMSAFLLLSPCISLPRGAITQFCTVWLLQWWLSAENSNLQQEGLMQLLKEMVHPAVVCLSAEDGCPQHQLWKTNKSNGNDSPNPANIFCWPLPKKAFTLNKHGTVFICCLKPLLSSTSLPHGSTRTMKSHKRCNWNGTESNAAGLALGTGVGRGERCPPCTDVSREQAARLPKALSSGKQPSSNGSNGSQPDTASKAPLPVRLGLNKDHTPHQGRAYLCWTSLR